MRGRALLLARGIGASLRSARSRRIALSSTPEADYGSRRQPNTSFNAVRHKLLVGGALAPLIFPLEYLSDGRFDLLGLEAAAPVKPLVNAFSLPFLVAAILGMIYGVVICKSRSSDKPLRQFGLSTGLAGAVLLFVIASLDVAGFFYLCPDPERFIARSFFAAHAVWILWLGYAAIAWSIGRIFKSFPIRALAYCVLILELPCVFIGEFGSGDWRTNYQAVESILNVFAAPAACYFAALVVLAVFMRKAERPTLQGRSAPTLRFGGASSLSVSSALSRSFRSRRSATSRAKLGSVPATGPASSGSRFFGRCARSC